MMCSVMAEVQKDLVIALTRGRGEQDLKKKNLSITNWWFELNGF